MKHSTKCDCPHWSDCGLPDGGCCALGRYGGRPSLGTCRACPVAQGAGDARDTHDAQNPRGLGDTVAKVAQAIGINLLASGFTRLTGKDCGCARRREALNRLVPYRQEPGNASDTKDARPPAPAPDGG